jgi:hypothetical protein
MGRQRDMSANLVELEDAIEVSWVGAVQFLFDLQPEGVLICDWELG